MPEVTPEVVKALETAIAAERQGMAQYLEFARKTADPTGKNMFIVLARDEMEHMSAFLDQLNAATTTGMLLEVKLQESEIERLRPKLRQFPTEKSSKGTNELGALRTALDQEKDAIGFYTEQERKTQDPHAKKMYRELIDVENSHYDLLQAQIDYITKTGYWFDIPEFRLEVE
jgi:rubrerythrin